MGDEKRIQELSAKELSSKLEGPVKPYLLDVREEDEFQIGHLEGAHLIPLMALFDRLNEVPKDKEIVAICRTGKRSARACRFLLQKGFPEDKVWNLRGGVHAWSDEIDPAFPKY